MAHLRRVGGSPQRDSCSPGIPLTSPRPTRCGVHSVTRPGRCARVPVLLRADSHSAVRVTQRLRGRAQRTLKRQKPHRGGAPTVLGRTGFLFIGGKRKSCITRLGAGRGYVSQRFGASCRPHHSRMHRMTKPATASPAPITAVSSQRDTQGNHPPRQPLLQISHGYALFRERDGFLTASQAVSPLIRDDGCG